MVNFCNPGVLGTPAQFRRHYEGPILRGREPDASETDADLAQQRSAELSSIVNDFILRRTNALLSAHLPPKVILALASAARFVILQVHAGTSCQEFLLVLCVCVCVGGRGCMRESVHERCVCGCVYA